MGLAEYEKQISSETSISLKVPQKGIFQPWLSKKTADDLR